MKKKLIGSFLTLATLFNGIMAYEVFSHKETKVVKVVVEEKLPVIPIKPIPVYDDQKFAFRYAISHEDIVARDVRYGITTKQVTYNIIKADGKSHPRSTWEQTVKAVFKKLPHIKTNKNNVSLVVETIITESNGGEKLVSKSGKDLGVAQIRLETANDLFKWLDFKHPDVKKSIMGFYDKNISMKENLKYNVPFSIAVCITEYWRKLGGNYHKKIKTLEKRAVCWKSIYNSSKGSGTVNHYIKRVISYGENEES